LHSPVRLPPPPLAWRELPMRLLVVEDSPLLRKMFGLAFPQQLNELRQAENGRQAIAILADSRTPFDAVLLDLRMPDIDGVEFIRLIRRLPLHGRTPIVLTTAEADDSDLMRAAAALGVAAVVKKPWTPQHLRQAVHGLVDSPTG
jgi:CheY-like chemotaxis protein